MDRDKELNFFYPLQALSLLVDSQSLLIKRTFVFPHNENVVNVVNDTNVVVEKCVIVVS